MSMDLSAANGGWFHANWHWWRCLGILSARAGFVFPEIWYSNSGDKVDFATCAELARKIDKYMSCVASTG